MDKTPDIKKNWLRWCIALTIVSVLIFLGVKNIDTLRSIVSWGSRLSLPLIIGIAIAVIIDVPLSFFERHLWQNTKSKALCKLRRPVAFILSIIIIIGCLVGIVLIVIPELIESVKIIIAGAIDLIKRFNEMSPDEYAELPFGEMLMTVDWAEILSTLQNWLKNQSGAILKGAFSTLSSVVVALFDFIVAFVFSIFILFSKNRLKSQSKRLIHAWLPKNFGVWLIHAGRVLHVNFQNFISGQTLEALILGILCMIGMLIFKIPYAPMVSVLVGITALIPVVGGFIGGGIGAFMILTVDPSKALFFVIFLVVLQQLEGNLIYPKVMGKKVNLPSIWILAAVTIGGGIAGPVGMLLSVPLTSTSYTLIKEATQKKERAMAKQASTDTEDESFLNIEDSINELQEVKGDLMNTSSTDHKRDANDENNGAPASTKPSKSKQSKKKKR